VIILTTSLLDLGIELDPDGVFPGLGRLEKKEWRKKILVKYFMNIGPFFAGLILVLLTSDLGGISAVNRFYFAIIFLLCVGTSFYFTRKDALNYRTLVWMASTGKQIKD